jgi:bifunctional non-homologous end joining protein LigD
MRARDNVRSHARRPTRRSDLIVQQLRAIEESGGDGVVELGGVALKVTNLGKVYFPETGHTKGDLMRYYVEVAPYLLPLMQDRPLVLKRFPDGVDGKAFYQQTAPDDAPDALRIGWVPSESTSGRRIIGGDLFTLLYCVQLGAIDVHPWHSRLQSLDTPDYTILDLDPGPKAPFATVVRIARGLKELLDGAHLTAGIKTSGSRGLHIVIPLPPNVSEEAAQLVSHVLAQQMALEDPEHATVVRSRSARPSNTVYVDYLQNVVGKSVAAAFSVRPRAGATVSTPLRWTELTDALDPAAFTIDTVPDTLAERGRLWARAMRARNSLDALLPVSA